MALKQVQFDEDRNIAVLADLENTATTESEPRDDEGMTEGGNEGGNTETTETTGNDNGGEGGEGNENNGQE